jgi:hypothetical protein
MKEPDDAQMDELVPEQPRMVKRSEYLVKGWSMADALDWCFQKGLDPHAVIFTGGGHLHYETPETDEERARRKDFLRQSTERHEKWEREMWETLKVKYG